MVCSVAHILSLLFTLGKKTDRDKWRWKENLDHLIELRLKKEQGLMRITLNVTLIPYVSATKASDVMKHVATFMTLSLIIECHIWQDKVYRTRPWSPAVKWNLNLQHHETCSHTERFRFAIKTQKGLAELLIVFIHAGNWVSCPICVITN